MLSIGDDNYQLTGISAAKTGVTKKTSIPRLLPIWRLNESIIRSIKTDNSWMQNVTKIKINLIHLNEN